MRIQKWYHEHRKRFEYEKRKAIDPKYGMEAGKPRFAEGYNFYKLVWIFLLTSFLGAMIEIGYVFLTSHHLMSRSSLLYGQFSCVWGFGGLILTVGLHRLIGQEDRYIFLAGALLGGAYEYGCSVFTEVIFGKVFWDYSAMRFNIGGRTNLLFMMFWGVLSVIWLKLIYPWMSDKIERFPKRFGTGLTWILLIFLVFDITVSATALYRMNTRSQGILPKNAVERFVDEHYSDAYLARRYENMKKA